MKTEDGAAAVGLCRVLEGSVGPTGPVVIWKSVGVFKQTTDAVSSSAKSSLTKGSPGVVNAGTGFHWISSSFSL